MAMALHFCGLIRATARAHAGTRHARRSFELACSERLVKRLRAAASAVRDAEPDSWAAERFENEAALREQGLEPSAPPAGDGSFDRDRAATRHGKIAADNISLVLRASPAVAGPTRQGRAQMQLPF
ncbi:MAG: hypothetical protein JWP15_2071 [Alphaproteobacteria bacterium]|nr:hypothetical protein [Alphaproteobacteria bacterium]